MRWGNSSRSERDAEVGPDPWRWRLRSTPLDAFHDGPGVETFDLGSRVSNAGFDARDGGSAGLVPSLLRVRDIALQLRERFAGGASISAVECGVVGPAVGLLELFLGLGEGSGCMSEFNSDRNHPSTR